MARLPEPGTPEYDAHLLQVRQRLLNGPRLRTFVLIWVGMAVLLVLPALYLILRSLSSDASPIERWGGLGCAVVLLLLPGRVVGLAVGRRMRTGKWSLRPTPEERIQTAKRFVARQTPRRIWWMEKFSFWSDVAFFPLYCVLLWAELGPHHKPLDYSSWFMVVFAAYFIVQSGRRIVQYRKKRTAIA